LDENTPKEKLAPKFQVGKNEPYGIRGESGKKEVFQGEGTSTLPKSSKPSGKNLIRKSTSREDPRGGKKRRNSTSKWKGKKNAP